MMSSCEGDVYSWIPFFPCIISSYLHNFISSMMGYTLPGILQEDHCEICDPVKC